MLDVRKMKKLYLRPGFMDIPRMKVMREILPPGIQ